MKAVIIQKFGGSDRLQIQDVPRPQPGPDEVIVAVRAASINPIDFKIRNGAMRRVRRLPFPLIMGSDFSGVVAEVGSGVTRYKTGDEVFARVGKKEPGAFAEYVRVSQSLLARKPRRLTHVEAASIPLVALTAWQALITHGGLVAGQRVLIHAGAGGVGSVAIQLARYLGATVLTTASESNRSLVESLGAGRVIEHRTERFEERAQDCDLVLDTVGGDIRRRSLLAARPGGRVVSISGLPSPQSARDAGAGPILCLALGLLNRRVIALARRRGVTYRHFFMEPSGEQLEQIGALLEQGVIRPLLDRVYPFHQVTQAMDHVEAGHTRGKVVLQLS